MDMLLPAMNSNRRAAADVIGYSEGTITSPLTRCAGFDVLVTGVDGPSVFTDFSRHPFERRAPIVVNSHGLASTASGKFQILLRFWLASARAHKYLDFSPYWQTMYVLQAWRERNALDLIDAGRFEDFIAAINGLWASLPGKVYIGQNQRPMAWLMQKYHDAGGRLTFATDDTGGGTGPLPLISPSQFGPLP